MGLSPEEWQQQEREVIDEFFKTKVPQAIGDENSRGCNEIACFKFGQQAMQADDLEPVNNQGCNSFTLISHKLSKIIQFRLKPFDTAITDLAHQIYGTKVPKAQAHNGFPLPVYSTDLISGKVHVLQEFPKAFPIERQKRTVMELGLFVALSTHVPQPKSSYRAESWTLKAKETLTRLQRNKSLDDKSPKIATIIARLLDQVHLLDCLPAVLTHHDFSEVNILVDEAGHVTGVVDFDVAGIEAFGMCIWGLYECFFGSMNNGKWSFHDVAAEGYPGRTVRQILETAFWESLWSNVSDELKQKRAVFEPAVRVALSIGVINRYFIRGMMDEIDESTNVHRLSLEYARGILSAIW